jgi:hypothetical protein
VVVYLKSWRFFFTLCTFFYVFLCLYRKGLIRIFFRNVQFFFRYVQFFSEFVFIRIFSGFFPICPFPYRKFLLLFPISPALRYHPYFTKTHLYHLELFNRRIFYRPSNTEPAFPNGSCQMEVHAGETKCVNLDSALAGISLTGLLTRGFVLRLW